MRLRFGELELDDERFVLERAGKRLRIRPKVFDLLVELIRNRERVVLRAELVMALWGTTAVGPGSLSGLMNELRRILSAAGCGPSTIRTVHARGYQFLASVESGPPDGSARSREDRPVRGSNREFDLVMVPIRASLAQVTTRGARAVFVEGGSDSRRSDFLDYARLEIARFGFDVGRIAVAPSHDAPSMGLVERFIRGIIEQHGLAVIRRSLSLRARSLLEPVWRTDLEPLARPREPLAARQFDEQLWRHVAELIHELARPRPLALILDDLDRADTAAKRAISMLLRLLGTARVFVLATSVASTSEEPEDRTELSAGSIEHVRLLPFDFGRLNDHLMSRGVTPLPSVLADALVAHVREDETSLESVVHWLATQGECDHAQATPLAVEPSPRPQPEVERRMRRVEPAAILRHPRIGLP